MTPASRKSIILGAMFFCFLAQAADPKQCVSFLAREFLEATPGTEFLDAMLEKEIHEIASGLAPKVREQFYNALTRSNYFAGPESALGSVDTRRLRIELPAELKAHPFARIVLVHEAQHLSEFVSSIPRVASFRTFRDLLRHNGLLNNETRAFRRQHAFIRKMYKLEDIPKLRAQYPSDPNRRNQRSLQRLGILDENGELLLDDPSVAQKLKTDHRAASLVKQHLEREFNTRFLVNVESALRLPSEDYVKLRLEPYERRQMFLHFYVASAFGLVSLTAPPAGYLVIQKILEKKKNPSPPSRPEPKE